MILNGRSTLLVSLVLLLWVSSLSFASCPTVKRDIYLAAVTGESSGGIFQLEVEVRPGNGAVYTSVTPRTGFSTQESEYAAVKYAFESAGFDLEECDVLFRMKGEFGDNTVDGPSAGGAMALATRAALLNKTIRQDVAMTGTIIPGGQLGEVGGIIEKAIAAAENGARYFVAPRLKVYEALLLSSVSRAHNFSVIEADGISDAEEVMLSGYSATFQSKFSPKSKPVPANLAVLPIDADIGRFTLVAKRVVGGLEAKVSKAFSSPAKNEESDKLYQYFKDEIAKYHQLLSMGYPFTSANSAFLLSIDAEYASIGERQVDLNGSFSDVEACVASLSKPAKTAENFHWAVGSDLRRIWSEKKLNETAETRNGQGGYVTLRDLLFANSWCEISNDLAAQANDIGGDRADESALKALAEEKLLDAEAVILTATKPDYDAMWHYESGLAANESGDFGAAIYEATYAATMQGISSEERENTSAAAQKFSAGERSTLWGKIYYSQGMYLYAEAKESGASLADAYRILRYSYEIDKSALEINRELEKAREAAMPEPAVQAQPPVEKPSTTEGDEAVSLFLAACIALLGFAAVYRLAGGREGIVRLVERKGA